jgi:hypothetical protein
LLMLSWCLKSFDLYHVVRHWNAYIETHVFCHVNVCNIRMWRIGQAGWI